VKTVAELCEYLSKSNQTSNTWFILFIQSHPQLCLSSLSISWPIFTHSLLSVIHERYNRTWVWWASTFLFFLLLFSINGHICLHLCTYKQHCSSSASSDSPQITHYSFSPSPYSPPFPLIAPSLFLPLFFSAFKKRKRIWSMASVFLYHVVGDLTVGKPDMVEFYETETVESAIRAIGESTECGIPVWKRKSHVSMIETSETRQQRFVGILNSLDIVAFLASTECLEDQDKAIKTSVSQVVVPNASLLKQVDPATRSVAFNLISFNTTQYYYILIDLWYLRFCISISWICYSALFMVLLNVFKWLLMVIIMVEIWTSLQKMCSRGTKGCAISLGVCLNPMGCTAFLNHFLYLDAPECRHGIQ